MKNKIDFDNDIKNSFDKITPNEEQKRKIFARINSNKAEQKRSTPTYKWLSVAVLTSLVLVIGGFAIKNILDANEDIITGEIAVEENSYISNASRYYYYKNLELEINDTKLKYANADPFSNQEIDKTQAKILGKGILISDHDTPKKLETDVYYLESEYNNSQNEIPLVVQAKSIDYETHYNKFILLRTDFAPYEETDKFKEVSDFYGGFSYILRHEETHGDGENSTVSMTEIKLDSDKVNEILNKSFTKKPTLVPHEYNLTGENLEFKIELGIFENTDINCNFTGKLYKNGYFQILYKDMNLIFYISEENANEIFNEIENKSIFKN